jgi:hypothetical protein
MPRAALMHWIAERRARISSTRRETRPALLRLSARAAALLIVLHVIASTLLASTLFAGDRPRLVVYLHTSIRSRALESALQLELPAVEVMVVSRHRDFARELLTRPDAALAATPVLTDQGWVAELRGTRAGQDSEPYVLLAIGAVPDPKLLSQMVIGAVDLLGRERTAAFLAGLLGSAAPASIKYVVKTEDLLALLQFQAVNAVVLSEEDAERIKSVSKLELRATPLPTRVGLPAVVFTTERGRQMIKPDLRALHGETMRKLGVDAWR